MKLLIACEFSGVIREVFKAKGWDAWSCDLLPTEIPGQHYQGSVFDILDDFSIIGGKPDRIIAHPPCTYLSVVGNRHINADRLIKRQEAFKFFMDLWDCGIEEKCFENPVGYVNTHFRKPDQIIHPYYFGEPVQKRTCLWLENLPKLEYTKTIIPKPEPLYICQGEKCKGKKIHFTEGIKGYKHRSHERSRTFQSIANAMAAQWG